MPASAKPSSPQPPESDGNETTVRRNKALRVLVVVVLALVVLNAWLLWKGWGKLQANPQVTQTRVAYNASPSSIIEPTPIPATLTGTPTWTPTPTSTPTRTITPTPTFQPRLAGTEAPWPAAGISPENAREVAQLARWGNGILGGFAWSPDGSYLAVASSLGIYIYDTQTWDEVGLIETGFWVTFLSISPDGSTLAVGTGNENITLWRVSDGVLLFTLQGHTREVSDAVFTRDGHTLVSWSEDGTIRLWNTQDGNLLHTLEISASRTPLVALSPDGETIASRAAHSIRLWQVADGSLLRTLEGHTEDVTEIVFSPDSQMLASTSADDTIRLWRVEDGSLLNSWTGEWREVTYIAFSPDNQNLLSYVWLDIIPGFHDALYLWTISDGSLLHTIDTNNTYCNGALGSFTFSPDGQTLAAWCDEGRVLFWRVSNWRLVNLIEWYFEGGRSISIFESLDNIAYSPDGTFLCARDPYDNNIYVWQIEDGSLILSLDEFLGGIRKITISPDGGTLATGSERLTLLRTSDGNLRYVLGSNGNQDLTFLFDGQVLAAAGEGRRIQLWNVQEGELLGEWCWTPWGGGCNAYERPNAISAAFSPDGSTFAEGTAGISILYLGRFSDRRPTYTLEGHTGFVYHLAFSPDGQMLVSAGDSTVRLWRVSDGSLLYVLEGHTGGATAIAFSADGEILASGANDGSIRLWRVSDGTLLLTLEGHTSSLRSMAFSPDGQMLASTAGENNIYLWDINAGNLLAILEGHRGGVNSVVFSPDGRILYSGSDDGTVRLWGVRP